MGKDQDVANRVRQEATEERRVPRAYTAADLDEAGQVMADAATAAEEIRRVAAEKAAEDLVNHPPHYAQGDIECIDAIEAALTPEEFRGYCKGNVHKYLWRMEHKGAPLQDVRKAKWYLDKLIAHMEGGGGGR